MKISDVLYGWLLALVFAGGVYLMTEASLHSNEREVLGVACRLLFYVSGATYMLGLYRGEQTRLSLAGGDDG